MQDSVADRDFIVKNGQITFRGRVIGDSSSNPGFTWLEFDEHSMIGSGANGVAFRGIHKILEIEHVIKLYFPTSSDPNAKDGSSSKAMLESRKNAIPDLSGVIAAVHHAGKYSYPLDIEFSVMESIPGPITLREWQDINQSYRKLNDLTQASSIQENLEEERESRLSLIDYFQSNGILKSVSLNNTAGFLGTAIKLFKSGRTHGDMNGGNILFMNKPNNPKSLTGYYQSAGSREVLGSLQPHESRLIDLGTSSIPGTTANYGRYRDCFFLVDNVKKLLREDFPDLNLDAITSHRYPSRKLPDGTQCLKDEPLLLAMELFRLICVMSIVEGMRYRASDSELPFFLDSDDLKMINTLLARHYEYNYIDVFDPTANVLLKACQSHDHSRAGIVNWGEFWTSWVSTVGNFRQYYLSDSDQGIRRQPSLK